MTDDAIAQLYTICDVKLSPVEENGRKFSHIERHQLNFQTEYEMSMFLVLTFCITTWGGGIAGFKSGTPAPAVRCSDHLATSFESFPQNIFFLLQGEALLVFPAASRIIMGDAGYEPVTTSLEVW